MNAPNSFVRHVFAVALLVGLAWVFSLGRADLPPVHFWNRILADAGFALLCLILLIGPLGRFFPAINSLLPFRRELGIAFAVAATLHVLAYARSFDFDLTRFFVGTEHHETILLANAFASANWIGLVALAYGLILALTSNDFSQRLLGRGWKFLQQQSYTLFILVFLHTGILVYLVIHAGYGIFRPIFWGLGGFTIILQLAGYLRTVVLQSRLRHPRSES
ncbi:MAG: ferric reductase-like transmembrane domain-containing protein [Chloroflexota bacterium]